MTQSEITTAKTDETKKTNHNSYYIYARYYYLDGTCYAPENGALVDGWGHTMIFDNYADARAYVEEHFNAKPFKDDRGIVRFESAGRYVLNHGETERPDYRIMIVRGKK